MSEKKEFLDKLEKLCDEYQGKISKHDIVSALEFEKQSVFIEMYLPHFETVIEKVLTRILEENKDE